jgi:tetratricopeptide (TPR) repeat protein
VSTVYGLDLAKILKEQENLNGPESIEAGAAAFQLGKMHLEKGELVQAGLLISRALKIHQKLLGVADPSCLEIAQALEKIAAAPKPGSPSSDRDKLTVSSDHVPYFEPLVEPLSAAPARQNSMAEMDRIEEAVREIHQMRRSTAPSLALAEALVKLADIYSKHAMLDEMEPLLTEALDIRETICGSRHLSVSTDLKNLGRLYYFMERYYEAEPLLTKAIEIRQGALGQLHSSVAEVAEWYAKLLRKTNRFVQAEEMETLIKESRAKYGGEWEMYQAAATKATNEEDTFLARALWLAALEEAKDFRFDDPRLSLTLESLAEIYWSQMKYEKAEPICKRILQIWESKLGPMHADVAKAAKNLAMVCERQGKHVEAAILYQQVLAINEKLLGVHHPEVLSTRESYGKARLMAQKQVELKVSRLEGRWNKSGWYRAHHKDGDESNA